MTENGKWLIEFSPGETRAALVDRDGRLVEMQVERMGEPEIVGSIHLGRVTRVEKGIGAAFVEFGDREPGFLGKARGVTEGEAVIVQVIRAAGGGKGAVLTVNPILRGNLLDMDPTRPGIRFPTKWPADKAETASRLEAVLPPDTGWLPRATRAKFLSIAGNEFLLKSEAARLSQGWQLVLGKAAKTVPPAMLAEAPDIVSRVHWESDCPIMVDDPQQLARIKKMKLQLPEQATDIHKDKAALFEADQIEAQLEEALGPRVEMPGGASLVIEETEALTAIDVNMGGSGGGMRSDNAIRNANDAAAREAARQIRLRNIGGLILVDFISMKNKTHRKQLVELLRREMRGDPVRHDVLGMTPAGLVEITRQRSGRPLAALFARPARRTARPLAEAQACAALRAALRRAWSGRTVLAADPAIVEALQGPLAPALAEVDRRLGLALELLAEPGRGGYEFRRG